MSNSYDNMNEPLRGLNRDRLPELPLDPPTQNEHPCWDCMSGEATVAYDRMADAGCETRYSVKHALESIGATLREEFKFETCLYHIRRGGVS